MNPILNHNLPVRRNTHVVFLVFSFLIVNQFFNIYLIPIHALRIIKWGYCLLLSLYVCYNFISGKFPIIWLKKWKFITVFLCIVSFSFLYLLFIKGQSISETFRVSIVWYNYLLLFILIKKSFSVSEIFKALTIFSLIWFIAWILGYLSPFPLYDASGVFDEQKLMSTGRGIIRLKVTGNTLMNLWGLWCLSIYVEKKKKKYLLAFITCLFFVILCVSRQHIIFYTLIGMLYIFRKYNIYKKILMIGVLYLLIREILPQTEIYQSLATLTSDQMDASNGGKDDIRILALKYYLFDYPQNLYSTILGNGVYHSHSIYGRQMYEIIENYGFILADIGFVGLYIYFGICGLLCFFFLFKYVYKIRCKKIFYGIKMFIYYLFLTNIFSHTFDISQIDVAISIYILYIANKYDKLNCNINMKHSHNNIMI